MTATGYTRQSSAQISSGLEITSASVNNEFNQLQSAFSGTSGHDHSGGSGLGPNLTSAAFGVSTATAGIIAALGSGGSPAGQVTAVTITGTSNQITVVNGTGAAGNPTISIATGYVGQTSITTLGTISTGVWNGTILTGAYGGTGVNNGANTITLGGNISTAGVITTAGAFITTGANSLTLTTTGPTSVTLPTSGTLVNSAVTTLSSLASIGTITTGVWQGIPVGVTYGGTGVSLAATGGASNVLLQASTGANITVRQLSAADLSNGNTGSGLNVLQTSPTLITPVLGAASGTSLTLSTPLNLASGGTNANLSASNGGIFYSTATAGAILAGTATANQILLSGSSAAPAWSTATYPATTTANQILYSSATNTVAGLATANSSVLVTNGSGVPSLSTVLPNGTTATTQSANDNSTKVATTAYVATAVAAAPSLGIQGSFKNLKHVWASNTTTTITADQVMLMNGSNAPYLATNVSLTLNSATSGANGIDTGSVTTSTWYYIYVIYNGSSVASLMSTSPASPSLPGGYTYYARIGAARTDGSSHFLGFIQYGRTVQYMVGSNLSALPKIDGSSSVQGSTSTPTFITESVSNFVPSTASKIRVIVSTNGSGSVNAMVVPNNNYGPISSITNPPLIGFGPSTGVQCYGDIVLESTNIYWAQSANAYLWCAGWEDNI